MKNAALCARGTNAKKRGATNSHTDARVYIRAHADYEHERAVRDFHCAQHVYVCMRACIYRRAASARTSKGGQANFGGVSRPFFFRGSPDLRVDLLRRFSGSSDFFSLSK